MPKNAAPKAGPPSHVGASKKEAPAKVKFADLPLAERRKRIEEMWKGMPKTKAVEFLIKMRRGGM